MSDELAMPEAPIQPPSLPFYEVWNIALRRPTLESYERLLQDPKATLSRAVVWLLVGAARTHARDTAECREHPRAAPFPAPAARDSVIDLTPAAGAFRVLR